MDRRRTAGTSRRRAVVMAAAAVIVQVGVVAAAVAQDAAERPTFEQAAAETRRAMSDRDLAAARRHLATAVDRAQSQAELDELERLQVLYDYVSQFWDLIRDGMGKLQATEELKVKGARVAVVEATREEVVVKAAGRLRRFRIENMPTSLVMALAERSLAHDAVSKVAVGAFLALDKQGDPKVTAKLWAEAAEAGLDVRLLMPELGLRPDSVATKPAVPTDAAALARAEAVVRGRFPTLLAQATTASKKLQLARALLEAGKSTEPGPVVRYVMLRQATAMAVDAGAADLACAAIDAAAEIYAVDALKLKADALEQTARTAHGSRAARELAAAAIPVAQQALEAGRPQEAERLAKAALSGARTSRNRALMQQATALARQIEARGKQP